PWEVAPEGGRGAPRRGAPERRRPGGGDGRKGAGLKAEAGSRARATARPVQCADGRDAASVIGASARRRDGELAGSNRGIDAMLSAVRRLSWRRTWVREGSASGAAGRTRMTPGTTAEDRAVPSVPIQ